MDYGLAVWSAEWMSATEACPRSCRQCCALFCSARGGWVDSLSNFVVNGCEEACNSLDTRDPFYSYLLFVEGQDADYRQLQAAELCEYESPFSTFLGTLRLFAGIFLLQLLAALAPSLTLANARAPFLHFFAYAHCSIPAAKHHAMSDVFFAPTCRYFNYTNNFTTSGYPSPPSPSSLSTLLELGGQFLSR